MDGIQQPAAAHPLDPLTADEIAAAAAAVRDSGRLPSPPADVRFITIDLAEPDKRALLGFEQGGPRPPRMAELVLLDKRSGETTEAHVSLADGAVASWNVRDDVQPRAGVAELVEVEERLRQDPGFQAALALRGVTDPAQIQVD